MDGEDIYASCPTSFSETRSIPIPNLCGDDRYYHIGGCQPYHKNYADLVQPHFGDAGILGRPPIKSSHWRASNLPIEAVTYDPLPAECADREAHTCDDGYQGDYRFSVVDIQRLNDKGDTVKYTDGPSAGSKVNVAIDDYIGHVQPLGDERNPVGGIYHYHGPPGWDDGDYADYVIGYALDGVPIMAMRSLMSNGKLAKSSYNLKKGATGAYHFDYEFTAYGNLDQFNGGYAIIDGVETYAYFTTEDYPYIFRNFHGVYDLNN